MTLFESRSGKTHRIFLSIPSVRTIFNNKPQSNWRRTVCNTERTCVRALQMSPKHHIFKLHITGSDVKGTGIIKEFRKGMSHQVKRCTYKYTVKEVLRDKFLLGTRLATVSEALF